MAVPNRWQFGARSVAVTEGLLLYLTEDAVRDLLLVGCSAERLVEAMEQQLGDQAIRLEAGIRLKGPYRGHGAIADHAVDATRPIAETDQRLLHPGCEIR